MEGNNLDKNWIKFSEEDEELIFQWLISEIVSQLRKKETRGRNDLRYLTKIKTQKMMFQICEDCHLDLTRMWYMFGGMVFTPFDILDKAKDYYYHQTSLTKNELLKTEELLGKNCIKKIKESLSEIFKEIFYKKTEEVLTNFYEKRAPPIYQELYSHFRSIKALYREITSPQVRLDFYIRSILPKFSPWKDVLKIQQYISEFQVEVAGIFNEHELQVIIDYSHLIENVLIQISWMKYRKINITSSHENAINTLLNEFTNIGWKYLATTIGIKTVRGTSADIWHDRFLKQKESLKKSVYYSLNRLEKQLDKLNLRPRIEVVEDFFKKEYQNMFDEAMGVTKGFEDQSKRKEIINKY